MYFGHIILNAQCLVEGCAVIEESWVDPEVSELLHTHCNSEMKGGADETRLCTVCTCYEC
jgi:hypothetical protein